MCSGAAAAISAISAGMAAVETPTAVARSWRWKALVVFRELMVAIRALKAVVALTLTVV